MRPRNFVKVLALAAGLLVTACKTMPEPAPTVTATISTYFEDDAKPVPENIYVGGQPGEIDLKSLKTKNITHVVNFRTPAEMDRLDFDEVAILKAENIDYTPIPIGGDDHPYTPAAMTQLAAIMKDRDGPVLLHCGSGYRASVITVAWLVEEQGMPLNEALTYAQGWWPLRLEQVMGKSFKLVAE